MLGYMLGYMLEYILEYMLEYMLVYMLQLSTERLQLSRQQTCKSCDLYTTLYIILHYYTTGCQSPGHRQ
jgi:hypothetical protein